MDKFREMKVPLVFAAVVAAMLFWAYVFGPSFVGAPEPLEFPEKDSDLVYVPIEETLKISSQISQLFVSISFGLFVIVGYALSRRMREFNTLSFADTFAGCAFVGCTFICFYLTFQLKYGQYAAIQHHYPVDGLRKTVAWFNEIHAKLAFWVGISAIPAFFIAARLLFSSQTASTHSDSDEAPLQQSDRKPARFTSVSEGGTGLDRPENAEHERGDV
ncbi:hypothetical protein AXZ77_2185 [Thioclava sp. ES.031]|uniref:hypothetical protein n=1 Tax=Thioclava sp. ES.031 TaxID=1798203 RepID=UPI000C015F10|nr:hypothetical protein [Thioclava sp. ES.031]PFG63577.1 hypothetical protein AXZ77_2185 [Thioclava sp. ES.031]